MKIADLGVPIVVNRPPKEVARTLRNAATNIERHGWVRGTMGHVTTGFCTIGAINYSLGNDYFKNCGTIDDTATLFLFWLQSSGFTGAATIPVWNDTEAKSGEEVVLYLRKYADELDPVQI